MSMVYCRGCGKELHESAPTCPHCGFVQPTNKGSGWMAITAFAMAALCFLSWFDITDWSSGREALLWFYAIVSLTLGSISINRKMKHETQSIISVVVASLTIMILIVSI